MASLAFLAVAVGIGASSLVGCAASASAGDPSTPPPSPMGEAAAPMHPAPFQAEEIRAATAKGRTYVWRMEEPGAAPTLREITFLEVTPTDAKLRARRLDAAGAPVGEAKEMRTTWRELQSHGEFPRGSVTTAAERITVPAGTFDCVRYDVRDPKDPARREVYYFARTLPGAPVLFYEEQGGLRKSTSTLVEHRPGAERTP